VRRFSAFLESDIFFQGLRQTLVQYNLYWKTLHRVPGL